MDNNSNNKNSRPSFTEGSNSRDSTYGGQWTENSREHRRDQVKNRDRGRDGEWNRGNRSFLGKRDSSRDEEDKISRDEQPPAQPIQPSSTFSAYNYSATDHSFVDNNRRTLSMMPAYNMMTPMNTAWNINPMDGMAMSQSNMTMNQPSSTMPMSSGLEMVPTSNSSVNPYAFMTMTGENMYGVVGMGNYCQNGMMAPQKNIFSPPVKEIIQLTKSVLYPPNPNAPRPTTRGKPLGCKTVFVGGLPEKATEEIIKEIFDRCGTVETIKMSKRNFCHIRFSSELFVENAIYFSGYRLKIENKDEAPYAGRLHVDYAQARNDQYEYECKQRALQRQARHQEQDYYRPTTPPVVHYTDHEASLICEKLKSEETFSQAACILITWLERGECTKKNSGTFYSMIQSTHNHVRKLQVDKVKYEEQLNEAKKMLKKQLEGIIRQFTEIGKIYKAASLQKCWDHFTKAQRKNIEMWKKQTEELKNAHMEEVINEREDEEMELSDDENDASKKDTDVELVRSQYKEHIQKLQEEIDSLKCQLEASQNEIMVMQSDQQEELKHKDNQLSAVRTALQNSKKEVLNLNQKHSKDEAELKELRAFKCRVQGERNEDNDLSHDGNDMSSSSSINLENDARLIGLISTFLNVHPFGANIDYICSFLHQIDSSIRVRDVENLMKRFPTLYKEESSGIGANLGKKWRYVGFQTSDSSNL